MVPRLITRIAILLAAYCALITPAPAQTQPKPADEVVRVSTELVQTDFMVFDKQGNFVDGLKREQFALKVDGKPRDFTFFDQVSAGSRREEAQLAAARGTATGDKGLPVPLDRGRTIVFFLDDYHLSNASMNQVRRMLRSFVDREMRQNDQVAVVSASGQIGFLQQITDNKAVIMAATERLRSFQSMALNSAEYPPMSEYHAFQVQMHDLDVLNFFTDALIKENPMLQRQQAAESVKGRASQILADGSSITTRTLAGFKSFLDSTVSQPSRKVVFFISDGFLLDRRGSDNFDRVQRVTAAAARSGTVIYSMDARGLGAGLPDSSQLVAVDPTGRLSRSSTGEVRAFQDGLNAMASDTGGRAFFNTNSLSNSVETGLKETSIYYLLAWRPESEEQRNPRFRRIEVSIVGRSDLVVRFRRGFGESPSDDDRKRAKDKAAPRKTPNQEVNAALRAPYPITALPVSIALAFLDTAQHGGTLTSSIKVDTSSLAVDREGETPAAVLDLAGLVLNDQGKSVSSFNKRITVRAMANGVVGKLPETFFYNHFSLIKPGLYQVRVAAVDVKQGTRGSSHQWIEIPDLQTNGLTMSSLIVGERKAEADIEPINANSTDPQAPAAIRQVAVNVDHRFARSSHLRFLTFIYNATTTSTPGLQPRDPKGSTVPASIGKAVPDLAVQVQIFRDNEPVITTPLRKMSTEGISDPRRVPYAADVRLDDLQVGAYVLQVTIIDRLAKSSASQRLNFQIE